MAGFTVLFVCHANVCRSPTAAQLVRSTWERSGLDGLVEVASAGTAAVDGAGMCERAAAWVAKASGAPVPDHHARRTTPDLLAGADIVLAADPGILSDLVHQDSSVRPRAFTMPEAALLGPATEADLVAGLSGRPHDADAVRDALAAWVESMDAARGLVPLPEPRRRVFRRSAPWDPGVPDAHGADNPGHRRVLSVLHHTTRQWAVCLPRAASVASSS